MKTTTKHFVLALLMFLATFSAWCQEVEDTIIVDEEEYINLMPVYEIDTRFADKLIKQHTLTHEEYIESLKNYSETASVLLIEDETKLATEYLKVIKGLFAERRDSLNMGIIDVSLSEIYLYNNTFNSNDDFDNAILSLDEAKSIFSGIYGENSFEIAKLLDMKGQCYFSKKNEDKAIDCFLQAMDCYFNAITNYDNFPILYVKGYVPEDIDPNEALEDNEIEDNEIEEDKTQEEQEKENVFEEEENETDSLDVHFIEIDIEEINNMTCYDYYFHMIDKIAHIYLSHENYDKTRELYSQAITKLEQKKKTQTIQYVSLLNGMGDCYSRENYKEQAMLYYNKATTIAEDIDDDNDYYGYAALPIKKTGDYYFYHQNYNDAIDYYLDVEDILMDVRWGVDGLFEEDNIDFDLGVKDKLLYCYYKQKNFTKANEYSKKALGVLRERILHNMIFGFTGNSSRSNYWNGFSELFQTVYPNIVVKNGQKADVGNLYDWSALFAKDILLRSDQELQRFVTEENDSTLNSIYAELISVYKKISLARESQEKKNLEEQAKRYEDVIRSAMWKSSPDILLNHEIKWENVRDSLDNDDIAIEFLSFPRYDNNSTMYIALTVRSEYEQPKLTVLCEESELLEAAKQPYTSKALSDLIWGKLAEKGELDNKVKNIYFSPSGELHNIAIESMPHWSKQGVMINDSKEGFNIYRLSSTRELAISRKPVESSDAAVYGGIDYSAPIDKMGLRVQEHESAITIDSKDDEVSIPSTETIRKSDEGKQTSSRAYEIVSDSTGTRDYLWWRPLQGSEEEATAVNSLLKGKGFDVYFKSDNNDEQQYNATETSFKQLAGQKRSIIHIATHGFYWNDSTALQEKMENNLNFMPANYESLQNTEKAMVRAGLLFTGAQNTFMGEKITDEYEDGVLTAQEVSQLDLRGLELLVLSACQTGLGEIGGDGVFGLQRGFKKAGAQTIVMSLWKVNDEATKDMMTSFYTHLMEMGMEHKREAFMKAQQEVRDNDSKYSYDDDDDDNITLDQKQRKTRPHWAAFIMLDGI